MRFAIMSAAGAFVQEFCIGPIEHDLYFCVGGATKVNEALVVALKWWKRVLRHDIVEQRRWEMAEEKLS